MKPSLEYIVPGVVVPCGRPRAMILKGHVHTYTPAETVAYQKRVELCTRAAVGRCPEWSTVFAQKLPVRIHIHFVRHAWRFDWDNAAKSVCDGIANAECVFVNDNRITQALVSISTDKRTEERAEILIETANAVLEEPLWMRCAREAGWGPMGRERTGT